MERNNLFSLLADNSYPGRGIVLGKTQDSTHAVISYFIMGRSENSRNRIFKECEGGIKTQAFDPAKLSDPSLIIYSPVRVTDSTTIVTNGDQTDTIYDHLKNGGCFEDALRTRTFEPDAPNYTPRISGIVTIKEHDFSYRLSILKSNGGNPNSVLRFFYDYAQPLSGEGHFIHTYRCDGDPIPSYEGEPAPISIETNDIDVWTSLLWNNLNEDNKVSLFTRFINLKTGEEETRIINKNK